MHADLTKVGKMRHPYLVTEDAIFKMHGPKSLRVRGVGVRVGKAGDKL